MKVSVVIPAYNEEKWIGRTLEVLSLQDYKDLEIIVVDNNSTDGTSKVVASFPNVKLILEERRGVQYARESGRLASSGDIVANLDADCMPPKDWVKSVVKYFADPKVVAVSGPYDYYDASLFLRGMSALFQNFFYIILHFVVSDIFHKGGIMIGGNVFIRADALEKIGGYNTSIVFYGDDTDTGNRLRSLGRVLYKRDICVESSIRRFDRLGMFHVFYKYCINFVWVSLFNRPYHAYHE